MKISAQVSNSQGKHQVSLQTDQQAAKTIDIPPKASGFGSSVNGGELLFLALATCYCNDIYREATREGINVVEVSVEVSGDFDGIGAPATNVCYQARVKADASPETIRELMRYTDQVAEIQNTLRVETPVLLKELEVVSIQV